MYGRTLDDFEYRGVKFRWVLSPNKLIYRVYVDSALIGTIPVSRVRLRHSPEAIKALYPICDQWLEDYGPGAPERKRLTMMTVLEQESAKDAKLVSTVGQTDPNTHYYGVHIIRGAGMSRQETLDALAKSNVATTPPFYFPCGAVVNEITNLEWGLLPLEDVPCPCGNPNHWFVKWSETLQDAPTIEAVWTDRTEDIPTALRQNTEGLLKLGRAVEKELAEEAKIAKRPRVTPNPKRKGRPKKVAT